MPDREPQGDGSMTAPAPVDPGELLRSRDYRKLLVFAAIVGLVVSFAAWGFLELVTQLQHGLYDDLPEAVGYETAPTWWPLPVLVISGVLVALAIERLPGTGGHEPTGGIGAGATAPIELPGVVLAALASIGFGMVLGPEGPLIALGSGLGVLAVRRARRQAPEQVVTLMAAAASFAAISSLFGSPIIGAVIIIEAAGLGGAMLPVVLLPGLTAAGIGSLVFVGMGSITGLSQSDYAIAPLQLPAYGAPTVAAFLWTILLAIVVAAGCFVIMQLGRRARVAAQRRRLPATLGGAIAIGLLALWFAEISGEPGNLVLFSGQDAMGQVVANGAALSVGTLLLLVVCKGLAYGISLGIARGGPTFPALFLGIVAGLLAARLPGFHETPAITALMAAATVAVLRLPLSSVLLATIVAQAQLSVTPLIIVAVVVAYITVRVLDARVEAVAPDRAAASPEPAPA